MILHKAKIVSAVAMLLVLLAVVMCGLSDPRWIESAFRVIDQNCRVLLLPQVCERK